VRAELKQQIVSGRLVVQLYDFIENGKRTSHLDIYEVRHGKIVHEWDQGP
jgi:predicted SnoaL-like aldol condensation-catalyzing enzyme